MIRTRTNKTPQLIITSDWHLREDTPVCRTDNFWEAQWRKVDFVKELQERYDCAIVLAGDLFHHWKASPYLLSKAIKNVPYLYACCGQHDLPQHNFLLWEKSGIYTLHSAQSIIVSKYTHFPKAKIEFHFCHWGETPDDMRKLEGVNRRILVWHKMTYTDEEPFPNCPDPPARKLLKKYPDYDLIVTGDNHQTFVEEYNGRILVNAGSLTRQTAAQMDHRPCVYLWYAETNTVEPVYLPIDEGVISREHIERKEERDGRLEAFISRLNTEYKTEISFEDNLRAFEQANTVNTKIMSIIYKAIEQ